MRARTPGALAVGILLFPIITFAQAPPRDRAAVEAPTGTGRLRGRVVAADTGSPLRRAQVRAVAATIRTTRLTTTDAEGRYEFANLPAARYTISVSKAGYVGLEFGQRRPFEGGRPLDLADAQVVEQIDFALPRGAVIAGRITDDAGDPIIGASVQAMRYQYGPTGRRRLGGVSQSWLSGMTNDLGEYRLFGLMPGTYIVSAIGNNFGVVSLTQAGPQTGGLGAIDTRDGYIQTYFPGTASVAEAQPVLVNSVGGGEGIVLARDRPHVANLRLRAELGRSTRHRFECEPAARRHKWSDGRLGRLQDRAGRQLQFCERSTGAVHPRSESGAGRHGVAGPRDSARSGSDCIPGIRAHVDCGRRERHYGSRRDNQAGDYGVGTRDLPRQRATKSP